MNNTQLGILDVVPRLARYITFSMKQGSDPKQALLKLTEIADGDKTVVGFGESLVIALGANISGLRSFPGQVGAGVEIPSTPLSLWCWLRDEDRGNHVHQTRSIRDALADSFELHNVIDAFQYGPSLDLTGYEDGTENPQEDEAIAAGIVKGAGPGMDGSSFVAVQQWVHDLNRFQSMPQKEQDNTIGRRKSDNEELDDAPASAHVKRTAQESFQPEAFILRRSMPWADASGEGLVFVSFGKSFDAFETLLKHMVGTNDGIVDGLFKFTKPISGSYFWCPPMIDGRLDLTVLDL